MNGTEFRGYADGGIGAGGRGGGAGFDFRAFCRCGKQGSGGEGEMGEEMGGNVLCPAGVVTGIALIKHEIEKIDDDAPVRNLHGEGIVAHGVPQTPPESILDGAGARLHKDDARRHLVLSVHHGVIDKAQVAHIDTSPMHVLREADGRERGGVPQLPDNLPQLTSEAGYMRVNEILRRLVNFRVVLVLLGVVGDETRVGV
mmetsp:Transcript_11975/g.33746  ORF Transcript_11975/g.33746 Transcript_11975/m.33746 type:complete len:200 (+) Transcript_11975:3158-3757(+)